MSDSEKHSPPCRLCDSQTNEYLLDELSHKYYHCDNCSGIQIDEDSILSSSEEEKRYRHHNNDINDDGYRNFLSQLLNPTLERITPNSNGLDYGSGPSPSLSVLFKEKGVLVEDYDLYFSKKDELLSKSYDFVCCSETAEHFKNPKLEFNRINKLLKKNRLLALMTLIYDPNSTEFRSWFYRKDPTHIFFYQERTIEYLCETFAWELEYTSERVFISRKS